MVLAITVLPIVDVVAKLLGHRLHPLHVTWGRYVFSMLFLAPVVLPRAGVRAFVPANLSLQVLRAVCLMLASVLFFSALKYLPLADVSAISFVYPVLVILAAPLILGERQTAAKLIAAAVGLGGAFLIIRPGSSIFHPASFLALATACVYALYFILTRKLAGTVPAAQMMLFTSTVGALILTLAAPFVWTSLGWLDWIGMAVMGVVASLGHLLVVRAVETTPASVIAPLGYWEIITMITLGWLVFDEVPDPWSFVGIAVIVASGLFVSLRGERPLAWRRVARCSPRPPQHP